MVNIASLQVSFGERVLVSGVHELLGKNDVILDKAFSKWVGNTANIVALFNSASRQCHEVWSLRFPFINTIKDTNCPNEACLYVAYKLEYAIVSATTFIWLATVFWVLSKVVKVKLPSCLVFKNDLLQIL